MDVGDERGFKSVDFLSGILYCNMVHVNLQIETTHRDMYIKLNENMVLKWILVLKYLASGSRNVTILNFAGSWWYNVQINQWKTTGRQWAENDGSFPMPCVSNMYVEVIYGTWPTEQPAHMTILDCVGLEVVLCPDNCCDIEYTH